MRFLFRLIPIILAILSVVTAAIIFIVPALAVWATLLFLIVAAYGIFEMLGRRIRQTDYWCAGTLLVLFLAGSFGFLFYLDGWILRALVIATAAWFVFFYCEQLYRWFYEAGRMPSYTLSVTISIIELLTVFFLTADLLGLRIFLHAPLWLVLAVWPILATAMSTINRFTSGAIRPHLANGILFGLLFGELFAGILYLPTGYAVGGAFMAIGWYVATGLLRISELNLSLRGPAKRYALVSGFLLIIVSLAARWS